jgi:hypothetical protein
VDEKAGNSSQWVKYFGSRTDQGESGLMIDFGDLALDESRY